MNQSYLFIKTYCMQREMPTLSQEGDKIKWVQGVWGYWQPKGLQRCDIMPLETQITSEQTLRDHLRTSEVVHIATSNLIGTTKEPQKCYITLQAP